LTAAFNHTPWPAGPACRAEAPGEGGPRRVPAAESFWAPNLGQSPLGARRRCPPAVTLRQVKVNLRQGLRTYPDWHSQAHRCI